jgi:(2Fe-2S) ferredoxin
VPAVKKYRISVCKGPVCRPGGSDRVFQAAQREVQAQGFAERCQVARGGCYGLCHLGPNVIIREDVGRKKDPLSREDFQLMGWEGETHYGAMTEERMVRVVAEHIGRDQVVTEFLAHDEDE